MNLKIKTLFTNLIFITFLVCGTMFGQSPFTGLVLEQLNNEGAFEGTTYRLYAEISEGKLYVIYGDESNPFLLSTTGVFFNNETFGGNFQSDINPALFDVYPTVEWDTWVTIGDSYVDPVNTIGDLHIDDFLDSSWSFGGSVNSDASIYRTPDDVNCQPNNDGKVLLGQFTTDGTLEGYMNLRIKDDADNVF